MNPIEPSQVVSFLRRYRLSQGRLRGLRIRHTPQGVVLDLILLVRTSLRDLGEEPKPVKLHLRLTDVEEFRFQKRPSSDSGRLPDLRIGVFQGQVFLNLDPFPLAAGETAGPHDYRGSDAYAVGSELFYKERILSDE